MKRPLLNVALLYISGVLLGEHIAIPLGLLLPGAWLLALAALALARVRKYLLAPLIVLVGTLNLTLHRVPLAPDDLRLLMGAKPEIVRVRGVLEEDPTERIYQQAGEDVSRTMARVRVTGLKPNRASWQPASGRLAVTTGGEFPEPLWKGQRVEIDGVLAPPDGPLAEGLFDYRAYLRNLGIYYQLQVQSPFDWKVLPPRVVPGLATRFGEWARGVLARGLPVEDEPLHLLWAMTLGWRTRLTGEVSDPFMRSGTLHVFAISGLHVALVCGIIVLVLRVFKVPRGACGIVVIPLLWFYAAVTGWPASAVRATVMMSVIIAGWSLHRPSDLLNSLAAAGLIILVWDPLQVFQASFQLSFSVVLSLALVGPPLYRWSQRWWQPDPFLPEELRSPWQRRLDVGWRWLRASLVTSLAAWLGSLPLIAHYFHLFTPVSLLANVFIVNLAAVALTSSLASVLCGAWWPGVSVLFNHSAWFIMAVMSWTSRHIAEWPGAWFYVRSPSAAGLALYYGILLSLAAGWWRRAKWRPYMATILGMTALWWAGEQIMSATQTRMTVLPLNGGHAIYFDAPGWRSDLLIDCGNESSVQSVVIPFFKAQGMNRLPTLALTHGDVRHVGGVGQLNETFPVPRIIRSHLRFRSPLYRKWEQEFDPAAGRARLVQPDDMVGCWKVLHPDAEDHFAQADDGSLVLWGDFRGTRILMLGDLGKAGQAALLTRYPGLRADIVVSGLPEKTEPLDNAFIQALQPQMLIIADSRYPATQHASRKVQARLRLQRLSVLYTRETGALTIELHRRGWTIVGMHGEGISGGPGGIIQPAGSVALRHDELAE